MADKRDHKDTTGVPKSERRSEAATEYQFFADSSASKVGEDGQIILTDNLEVGEELNEDEGRTAPIRSDE